MERLNILVVEMEVAGIYGVAVPVRSKSTEPSISRSTAAPEDQASQCPVLEVDVVRK